MDAKDIEKHILKKFMYSKELGYNEIRTKDIESNKFNYHLQKLLDKGILQKNESTYQLTSEGARIIS
jgi:predicted transcriptional regulator